MIGSCEVACVMDNSVTLSFGDCRANEKEITDIASALRDEYRVRELCLNHWKGEAVQRLAWLLGGRVHPCPTGSRLRF